MEGEMKDSASVGNLFAHDLKVTSARKEYVWQLLCPLKRRATKKL